MFEEKTETGERQEENSDIFAKKFYKDILEKILEGKNREEKEKIIRILAQILEEDLLNLLNSSKEIKEVA